VVRGHRYQKRLRVPNPQPANECLCWSLIQEKMGLLAGAGIASLHAAWACDDANASDRARAFRLRAVKLLERARAVGQRFAAGPLQEDVLLIDLLRRGGERDRAKALCRARLGAASAQVSAMLRFQSALLDRGDTAGHTMAELAEECLPGSDEPH
jgi:hypothetical protein